MHTFQGDKVTFNYNSDLSGDVTMTVRPGEHFTVPGKDLLDFISNYVRDRYISRLEGMGTEEILGIATKGG